MYSWGVITALVLDEAHSRDGYTVFFAVPNETVYTVSLSLKFFMGNKLRPGHKL